MTRKIVDKPYTIDLAGNIKYPEPPKASEVEVQEEPRTDVSIDTLLLRGLSIIDRILKACWHDALSDVPARETVQNLRDCMTMLKDLKKEEKELLQSLNMDELEAKIGKQ